MIDYRRTKSLLSRGRATRADSHGALLTARLSFKTGESADGRADERAASFIADFPGNKPIDPNCFTGTRNHEPPGARTRKST